MAKAKEEGAPEGVPSCPSCGQPIDDIQKMDEAALLETIHLGLLRDLARTVRAGTANHQSLAIARGLLRDNKKLVTPDEDTEDDENLPEQGRSALPSRSFKEYGHDE